MTIVESIKCVLQQNNDGLTSKQIYDEIIRQGLYSFGAENDTLLSEDGIKTLNAYALKGYRLITDYPLFDKPTSREEFLDAFNVAMQFYEKKDS